MKHLKIFEEFTEMTDKVEVISIDDIPFNLFNKKIEKGQYEFSDFDFVVVGEYNGEKKKFSIPHDMFIEFLKNTDEKLNNYLSQKSIQNLDDVLELLKDFNWDFSKSIKDYTNDFFSPSEFKDLEDELSDWDNNDQDDYDSMLED